jgi:hypothetical protein
MVSLPITEQTPVIRTDFSSPAVWAEVRAAIVAPADENTSFAAYVHFVDDPAWADHAPEQILASMTAEFAERHRCLFIVDKTTVSTPGWPVLVMDLADEEHQAFRAIADELAGIEANLWMGNISFSSYTRRARGTDGVFGGRPARLLSLANR